MNVGELRFQSALVDAKELVEVVSDDPEVSRYLAGLKVVRAYPDTRDSHGNWNNPTFKIKVAKK